MKKAQRIKVAPETLETYRSLLPYGARKEIAARLGVRDASITDFLAGRMNSWRIEEAILDYIADFQANRNAKLEKAGLR